ncbi:hypothetical protein CW731_06670 [Polaribacter sp. ALD11]|uniref:hypothetical protein n=1 Tax=Polaribacter sp. ALD11 TaxID=2058137 RepID=UPI000C2FF85F|nr:hypothetical protein [Polaribacter sp. ALD11]AUC84989.1 hypothetical protein CW731_06670 [Polaribacter sp. ALD11]
MKNTIKYLAFTITISLAFLVSCSEFTEKINNFNVGVTNAIFEQSAVIELKDYFGDQANIVATDFTVTFTGADADKLVNEAGEFTLTETDGFIQLNANPNKSTGVKELNFDITVSGGNYVTHTYPVKLTDTTNYVPLILLNNNRIKLNGIDTASKSAVLTNNATVAELDIETSNTNSLSKSTVNIKTGTIFKNAAGNTLNGNNLNVYLENTDANGITQYLSDYTFKDANGVTKNSGAKFYTGNTEITMDIDGADVKEFTKPIDVTIQISATANNPFTNKTVKLGDTLPVYTIEEDSTEWTYHGLGTLVAGANTESFSISFQTTHLSSYSVIEFVDLGCDSIIDYNYDITAENLPEDFSGSLTIDVLINIGNKQDSKEGAINLFEVEIENGKITSIIKKLERLDTNLQGSIYGFAGLQSFANALNNAVNSAILEALKEIINSGKDKEIYTFGESEGPLSGGIEYKVAVKLNGEIIRNNISSISTFTDCNLAINLTKGSSLPSQKTIAVGVAANCGDKNFIPDGFHIYVERSNGAFSYEGTFNKGFVFLKGFELGKEYNFKIFYQGKSYFHKWTFNSTTFFDFEFKLPDGVCDQISL